MKKVTLNIYDKDRKIIKAVEVVEFDKTNTTEGLVYAELETITLGNDEDEVIHVREDLGYMYADKYYNTRRYAIVGVVIN